MLFDGTKVFFHYEEKMKKSRQQTKAHSIRPKSCLKSQIAILLPLLYHLWVYNHTEH